MTSGMSLLKAGRIPKNGRQIQGERTHCSGFIQRVPLQQQKERLHTDAVQAAIDEMEEKATQPTKDGQQSNSATKAVAEVLTKHTKKPMFLKHVGVQHVHERSSRSDRKAEQEAQKRGNAELRALVETLNNKLQESEEARIRQEEERTK
ncbi:uncharacterized protein LOC119271437 [Triticum dicoccoides]|uniref:uncharacterized protein LOC119271437 n=1 Tax=Triticum dicoccoides TaxID=85692 RepID=UPI00188E3F29|nr:uncharacterized protein LOC119271437 [Triticum dicoccoides]